MSIRGDDSEVIVARLRPHARAIFWPCVLLVAVSAALGYFGGLLTQQWQLTGALAIAAVLVVTLWLAPLCSWLATNYTITTRRIVLRRGILVRYRQELWLSRGYDITLRASLIQSMFGSGDIEFSAGSESSALMRDVPSAALVHAAVHDLLGGASKTDPSDRVRA